MKSFFISRYKEFVSTGLINDILSGITVASVAIPLSLAIATASEVSYGAALISAIIGGIIAALFGGTKLAVTGPAAGIAVLIANTIEVYSMSGLLIICVLCGIFQILSGVFKLGQYAKLVPLSIISAFTAGIGIIIIIGQLPIALQIPASNQAQIINVVLHIANYIDVVNLNALLILILTIVTIYISNKYIAKIPSALLGVIVPTVVIFIFKMNDVALIHQIPHSLSAPKLPDISSIKTVSDYWNLIVSASVVFALASLQTLLSSSAIDRLANTRHEPNQELIGQGLANISVACFGGIPVTNVIARSSVNVLSGGKTRRSAIFHSLFILMSIYYFPQLIEMLPIPALSGVLIYSAVSMIKIKELISFWKDDRTECYIYLATLLTIVFTDLIQGIQTGVMVAFILVVLKMVRTKTSWQLWANNKVLRVHLAGNMPFWSADLFNKLHEAKLNNPKLEILILEIDEIMDLDRTAINNLAHTITDLTAGNITVVFHKTGINHYKALESSILNIKNYLFTQNESQIITVLKEHCITYTVMNSLKHQVQRYLNIKTYQSGHIHHTLLISCIEHHEILDKIIHQPELLVIKNLGCIIGDSEIMTIEFAINQLDVRNIILSAHHDCTVLKNSTENKLIHLSQQVDKIRLKIPIDDIYISLWVCEKNDIYEWNANINQLEKIQLFY